MLPKSHLCATDRAKDKSKSPSHSSSESYTTANTLVLLHKTHHFWELKSDQTLSLTKTAKHGEQFCSKLSSKCLFPDTKNVPWPHFEEESCSKWLWLSHHCDWLDKKHHRKQYYPTAVRDSFLSALCFLPGVHMKETAQSGTANRSLSIAALTYQWWQRRYM